ncbi:hypothetical protein FRC01_009635, partial [Tulasnella sp. 417]
MTDASQLTFHEKFNFHDGNIIISASGSRDGRPTSPTETIYFRLHKSVLAIYSSTFADMLALPQGNGDGEQSIVHLQDPLNHVINLFTTIYYGGSVPQEPLRRATWDFIAPVLMLADKYDMTALGTSLLPKLLEDWPTTLEKWDDVDKRTRAIVLTAPRRWPNTSSLPPVDAILPEPVMAVRFGQAHPGARSILPAVFYHLSRLSNSTADDLHKPLNYDSEVYRSADYNLMTSEDWRRVVRGQANIREWLDHRSRLHWNNQPLECGRRIYEEMDDEYSEGTENPCGVSLWWSSNIKPSILRIGTRRVVDVLAQLETIQGEVEGINRATTSDD